MRNDRSPRFLTEFGCSACMVDVGVRNNNGFDIREGTEKMLPLLTERRGEMVAQNQGIRAKKGKSAS